MHNDNLTVDTSNDTKIIFKASDATAYDATTVTHNPESELSQNKVIQENQTDLPEPPNEQKSFRSNRSYHYPNTVAEISAADTTDLGASDSPVVLTPESLGATLRHLDDACPKIAASPASPEADQARYIFGKHLGSGAIGQVVEAWDQHLSRYVAVKILHGQGEVSQDRLARFVAEAQITAQLEHPAIVPVHEIGRMPHGIPYYAMKAVRGNSLETILSDLRLGSNEFLHNYSPTRLLRLFHRLCQGMAYAHQRGVVHRDLKPANIMIGDFGEILIMDWGLAKVVDTKEQFPNCQTAPVQTVRGRHLDTRDGAIAGTPAYMAPEQARGEVDLVSPATDVYALGLILAELITHKRVFPTTSSRETLAVVRNATAVDLSAIQSHLHMPLEVIAIVRKCTQPKIEDRYNHAGELAEDIGLYLESKDLHYTPEDNVHQQRVHRWLKRHPLVTTAIVTSLIWFTLLLFLI